MKSQPKQTKTVPHNFSKRIVGRPYCSGCGLMLLNNEATRKRAAKPCESLED